MGLGLRAKTRGIASVQIDYLIHIQEIKPWPPSQSLRSLRAVLIQWENGDRSSGSTSLVVPSIGSVVGEGKIEFNESFRLPVTLLRDMSVKGGDSDTFKKNCLELNLYEPRRDKTVKGQLLGTAIIDLADYGILKETASITAPLNCKRSFRNIDQPVLSIKIQPADKGRTKSLPIDRLSKGVSMDSNGGESVSELMNEEYAEEAEIASFTFTDEDVSSHSSLTVSSASEFNGSVPPQHEENEPDVPTYNTGTINKKHDLASEPGIENMTMISQTAREKVVRSSSFMSTMDVSSDLGSPINGRASISNSPGHSSVTTQEHFASEPVVEKSTITPETTHGKAGESPTRKLSMAMSSDIGSPGNGHASISSSPHSSAKIQKHVSSASLVDENVKEESTASVRSNDHKHLDHDVQEMVPNGGTTITSNSQPHSNECTSAGYSRTVASPVDNSMVVEKPGCANCSSSHSKGKACGKYEETDQDWMNMDITSDDTYDSSRNKRFDKESKRCIEDESLIGEGNKDQVLLHRATCSLGGGNIDMKGNIMKSERLKHVKSVRSPADSARSTGSFISNHQTDVKEADMVGDAKFSAGSIKSIEGKDAKIYPNEARNVSLDKKVLQLEHKIKMLEGELREAAAIEAALYSVVAEHGSSMSKVHAPARRLARLYLHAYREKLPSRRAGAARSAVSGLVLVAKACGNDVPRLTFWLSNSIMLRTFVSESIDVQLPLSTGPMMERKGDGKGDIRILSPLIQNASCPGKAEKTILYGSFGTWEDPYMLISALEKIESWVFSRIVESIWWQILTPHMQHVDIKATDKGSASRKTYRRISSTCDEDQGNFSLDLWKNAFSDACERLCPVRAGGHECGCLAVLASLIMEQCVARLDVAMFNAILRESAEEIPTDPVSDPISDPKVLPIPAGISSFGAGAQLKNAIGNWCRWMTDLFGMDTDDSLDDIDDYSNNDDERQLTSFKSFHLLNALSDLLMLPKDMLLNRSIRKEVCPMFSTPLIKRIIDNFVPDEFCPDPVPDVVLEALDSEDPLQDVSECVTNFPCIAAPTTYSPPSTASVTSIIGEAGSQPQLRRSGSSVLRKSYTSDDELDELKSPLASVLFDGSLSPTVSTKLSWKPKENHNENAARYELLKEVWMNSE
ncbi:EEIG1/EHBP1 N-terminal domain containing protein [Quillaja saponaria]|uniref:EEIG1/EHBP1 N-terminal domain containing protein n=1 Tax=Quillaja saponaria TaxID=32244 RepID=A0AAD7Q4L0_QUISA|nr:EEIG1/EHBP1 N-terminal domain containing protein [Quillaja saponaria]